MYHQFVHNTQVVENPMQISKHFYIIWQFKIQGNLDRVTPKKNSNIKWEPKIYPNIVEKKVHEIMHQQCTWCLSVWREVISITHNLKKRTNKFTVYILPIIYFNFLVWSITTKKNLNWQAV